MNKSHSELWLKSKLVLVQDGNVDHNEENFSLSDIAVTIDPSLKGYPIKNLPKKFP